MPGDLILMIVLVLLMPLLLGLPLLLRPDSRIPDYLGFSLLGAMLLFSIWLEALWWVLLPILALAGLTVWLDRAQPEEVKASDLDKRGMSARTRLCFRLGCATRLAFVLLVAAPFVLPRGSAAPILLPGLLIVFSALVLFSFTFWRSWRRDGLAATEAVDSHASPAPLG